jgi:hypothetical protein
MPWFSIVREATMAIRWVPTSHGTWEDWLGIGLGAIIGATPFFVDQPITPAILYNAIIIGLLVLVLSSFELVDLRRWEEIGQLACGVWLAASPYALDYAQAGALRWWHYGLGALVALVAALELWQDWRLSSKELAEHGR